MNTSPVGRIYLDEVDAGQFTVTYSGCWHTLSSCVFNYRKCFYIQLGTYPAMHIHALVKKTFNLFFTGLEKTFNSGWLIRNKKIFVPICIL
jgi:hypothetical protein